MNQPAERSTLEQLAQLTVIWNWHADEADLGAQLDEATVLRSQPVELTSAAWLALVHIADRARVEQALQAAVEHGSVFQARHRIVGEDGTERWVKSHGTLVCDGATARLTGGSRRSDAAWQGLNPEDRLALAGTLLESMDQAVALLDDQGRCVSVGGVHGRWPGLDCLVGHVVFERIDALDRAAFQAAWEIALAGSPASVSARWHGDDSWQWAELQLRGCELGGRRHVVTLLRDPGEARELDIQLLRQARYDVVTGLPNRALFIERLGRAVQRAARDADYTCGVLFLDIDRFKIVNDSLGHGVGDDLLRMIAQRLTACVRPHDTIARLGSDEFGILLHGIDREAEASDVAARIHAQFGAPLYVNRHEIVTSVSIGIAVSQAGYTEAPELLRDADTALHRAKLQGKGRSELFDRTMQAQVMQLLRLESELRSAVWHEVLQLHYQPIISLADGAIVGAEALVRWHHAERGFVSPAEFIPLAEETGLIVPIGEWVLRTACLQAKAWQDAGMSRFHVAVNLSARQFNNNSVPALVEQTITEIGLERERLKLELTESSVMENADVIIPALHRLKSSGIEIAMDDFGTGYSSLSYLKRLPIGTLKIDRSFIRDVLTDAQGAAIVRATIAMAHSLDLVVVAEGVETEEQLAFLAALRCDAVQGFLMSRPVPAAQLTEILERGHSLLPAGAAAQLVPAM